jgi:hypothetical protein
MANNLDYLIPQLRMEMWDVDSTAYRYTDEWLRVALLSSVKALQRWWLDRYQVDYTTQDVYRNPSASFDTAEPPVIAYADEEPVILMAAFLIRVGVLESNSWAVSTWRDAEYYVSNVESGRLKESAVKATWDRLLAYLKPPSKRLNAGTRVTFDFGADETT